MVMMRSRVSAIARPQAAPIDEAAETSNEAAVEDVGSSAPAVIARGGIRTPAAEIEVPSAEVEAPSGPAAAPKRRGPKPGTPRKPRAEKTPSKAEDVTPVDQMAAPQVRAELKELEAKIKEAHARHKGEIEELRSTYRVLHDRLFDLTK